MKNETRSRKIKNKKYLEQFYLLAHVDARK